MLPFIYFLSVLLVSYPIYMGTYKRGVGQESHAKLNTRKPSFRYLHSCFPGKVTPIRNYLLQRIKNTLYISKNCSICTKTIAKQNNKIKKESTPSLINHNFFLFCHQIKFRSIPFAATCSTKR